MSAGGWGGAQWCVYHRKEKKKRKEKNREGFFAEKINAHSTELSYREGI